MALHVRAVVKQEARRMTQYQRDVSELGTRVACGLDAENSEDRGERRQVVCSRGDRAGRFRAALALTLTEQVTA